MLFFIDANRMRKVTNIYCYLYKMMHFRGRNRKKRILV